MPFKSEAQRRFLFAKHPAVAKRWAEQYGTPKDLPARVGKDESGDKEPSADKAASLKGEGVPMSLTFEENVIDTLQVAAAALEKAELAHQEKQARDKEASSLIPEAVDACIKHGRVDEADREKLAQALRDPVKALKVLVKVASHRNVEEASHLGSQVGQTKAAAMQKKAAHGSVDSPFCGGRTADVKPSDLALFRGLGIQS